MTLGQCRGHFSSFHMHLSSLVMWGCENHTETVPESSRDSKPETVKSCSCLSREILPAVIAGTFNITHTIDTANIPLEDQIALITSSERSALSPDPMFVICFICSLCFPVIVSKMILLRKIILSKKYGFTSTSNK